MQTISAPSQHCRVIHSLKTTSPGTLGLCSNTADCGFQHIRFKTKDRISIANTPPPNSSAVVEMSHSVFVYFLQSLEFNQWFSGLFL